MSDYWIHRTVRSAGRVTPGPYAVVSAGVVLGANVTIGPGAYIAPDVTVGDNAIVGAHALILTNLPEDTEVKPGATWNTPSKEKPKVAAPPLSQEDARTIATVEAAEKEAAARQAVIDAQTAAAQEAADRQAADAAAQAKADAKAAADAKAEKAKDEAETKAPPPVGLTTKVWGDKGR